MSSWPRISGARSQTCSVVRQNQTFCSSFLRSDIFRWSLDHLFFCCKLLCAWFPCGDILPQFSLAARFLPEPKGCRFRRELPLWTAGDPWFHPSASGSTLSSCHGARSSCDSQGLPFSKSYYLYLWSSQPPLELWWSLRSSWSTDLSNANFHFPTTATSNAKPFPLQISGLWNLRKFGWLFHFVCLRLRVDIQVS